MGLYLCIFDGDGTEIHGLEVGLYRCFGTFRQLAASYVDRGVLQRNMRVLLNHMDCDGTWSAQECRELLEELAELKRVFLEEPPSKEVCAEKAEIFRHFGLNPGNLFECFVDSDGEFLIDRMIKLCEQSAASGWPVVFQ